MVIVTLEIMITTSGNSKFDVVGRESFSDDDVFSTFWFVFIAGWTGYFLWVLIDTHSFLTWYSLEIGRSHTEIEFLVTDDDALSLNYAFAQGGELQGRTVTSTFNNWLVLILGGFVTYIVSIFPVAMNMRQSHRRRSRMFLWAMACVAVVQVGLMAIFHDTINTATSAYTAFW